LPDAIAPKGAYDLEMYQESTKQSYGSSDKDTRTKSEGAALSEKHEAFVMRRFSQKELTVEFVATA